MTTKQTHKQTPDKVIPVCCHALQATWKDAFPKQYALPLEATELNKNFYWYKHPIQVHVVKTGFQGSSIYMWSMVWKIKNQGVFVKHYIVCPRRQQNRKSYFSFKVKVKVTDLGIIWKGIISEVCMPNMKPLSYSSKVITKVKVDNRQTDRQTNRLTNRQTDRTKTICPRSFDPGA